MNDDFFCPACGGELEFNHLKVVCWRGNHSFSYEKGIPLLFWSNEWTDSKRDVTDTIKSFYEKYPFPSYEDIENRFTLMEKARKGVFARLLDEQIPHNSKVLEVGCGTGQLSNFLGLTWGRKVFGADICLNSLKLGQEFKNKNKIDNVTFLQMNLFKPVFKKESFDFVISNGVLHHTSDPFLGFRTISGLVKKGGYIAIGLYNKYGRVPTDFRRFIFKITNRLMFLDFRFRDKNVSDQRKRIWFMDQYENPHESKHTFSEALGWFDKCGFEFVSSIPKLRSFEPFHQNEELFKVNQRGTKFDRFLTQLKMLISGGKEGGFFIMIGLKK